MKKLNDKKKYMISLLFFGLLFTLTFHFLFKDQEMGSLAGLIRQVDYKYLAVGLVVMVVFFGLEAINLKALLGSFHYKLSLGRCMKYSLIDFYFSSITPGACGGQPAQICYMKKDEIQIGSSSLTLLLFNLTYHMGILLIWLGAFAYAWFGQGEILFSNRGILRYLMIYGVLAQSLLVTAFFAAVFSKKLLPRIIHAVVGLLAKIKVVKRPEGLIQRADSHILEYQKGAAYIKKNPKVLLLVLLVTIAHLAALFSIPFWVFKAFGLSGIGLLEVIGLQAALTLSVESLPLPGGMGAAENGYLLIYASIFGHSLVLPAMLLSRGLNYYFPLVVGGVVSAFAQISGKRKARQAAGQTETALRTAGRMVGQTETALRTAGRTAVCAAFRSVRQDKGRIALRAQVARIPIKVAKPPSFIKSAELE